MYETEANSQIEALSQVPAEVAEKFRGFRETVVARTMLPWGEHCTECVWPTCYTTCDLYSPRADGRCRRFVEGMVRLDCPGAVNSYLLKIQFKRWAKLWAPGNISLVPLAQADRGERWDRRIGATLFNLPAPDPVRNFMTGKRYSWKKRLAVKAEPSPQAPDLFVIECYNPGESAISLSLTIRSSNGSQTAPYQRLIPIPSGFHRERIPVADISGRFDLSAPFSVDLIPNEISDGATLFFGLIDFVASKPEPRVESGKHSPVKCVVWDLDNTMWDGILVEEGPAKLVLKPGVAETIQELDRRGILNSIASKNDHGEAMEVLKAMGIDEYFLHPQISWKPKSDALRTIAGKLNIGIDTLLFVDDSPFELAEVAAACPEVRTLEAGEYRELPNLSFCQVPVTGESANRSKMYREEMVREYAGQQSAVDYVGFLRDCRMEMQLEPLSPQNLNRVHELTQRTNQMNFSGTRYERAVLEQIANNGNLDTYVITCQDRFGSYGIVGFSIVDVREPRMTDLMFSCRIQAKRVEHAFLTYLIEKHRQSSDAPFRASYRRTPRNEPSGKVFADIGMEVVDERDGVTSLVFPAGRPIPNDGIIRISAMQTSHQELVQ